MLPAIRRCAALKQPAAALRLQSNVGFISLSSSSARSLWTANGKRNDGSINARQWPAQRSFFHTSLTQSQSASPAALDTSSGQHAQAAPDAENMLGPIETFSQLLEMGLVDRNIVDTLTKRMGFDKMTQVQSLTITEAMKGIDILAQAKTGTGKTIAFVLPILQRIMNADPSLRERKGPFDRQRSDPRSDIRAIIISPTRELAEQIAVETRKLVSNTGVKVQVAVGGTQKGDHLRQMDREGCHILVATPGRLNDLLEDPRSRIAAPKLEALVLDEADRLMDEGFWPQIQEIDSYLPDPNEKDRQTLMFSATISREIAQLARGVLKPDHHYVKTVQENEKPFHEQVPQRLVLTNGFENVMPALYELCVKAIQERAQDRSKSPFKALVYFNSTAETDMAHRIFSEMRHAARRSPPDSTIAALNKTPVFGISSRLSQRQRQTASDLFRSADSAIMMSSDVTARGMDFPNVTHVIQMGIPPTRDSYIHRVGRTARAGKEGQAWTIMPVDMAHDRTFDHALRGLPLTEDKTLENATFDLTNAVQTGDYSSPLDAVQSLREAYKTVNPEDIDGTFRSSLGTLQKLQSSKFWLRESLDRLAKVLWGFDRMPYVPDRLLAQLGLKELMGASQDPRRRQSRFEDDEEPVDFGRRPGFQRDRGFGSRGERDSRPPRRDSFLDRPSRPSRGRFGQANPYGNANRDPRSRFEGWS